MQRPTAHEGLVAMYRALLRPLTGGIEPTADPC
jgi:hypothetical protein